LTTLPENIGKSTALIGNLTQLTFLKLDCNCISNFPENIDKLRVFYKNLTKLDNDSSYNLYCTIFNMEKEY